MLELLKNPDAVLKQDCKNPLKLNWSFEVFKVKALFMLGGGKIEEKY